MSEDLVTKNARKQFQEETADHVLTVLEDTDSFRRVLVATPGTRMFSWEVASWPGHLVMTGDIADGYMFQVRSEDPYTFFRRESDPDYINLAYWSEKLPRGLQKSVRSFDADVVKAYIKQRLVDFSESYPEDAAEAREAVIAHFYEPDGFYSVSHGGAFDSLPAAQAALNEFPKFDLFNDWYDSTDLQAYDHHYILACLALQSTINLYDLKGKA